MTNDNTITQEIGEKMELIAAEVREMEERLANYAHVDKPHWGHVGDLNHILAQLQTINGKDA